MVDTGSGLASHGETAAPVSYRRRGALRTSHIFLDTHAPEVYIPRFDVNVSITERQSIHPWYPCHRATGFAGWSEDYGVRIPLSGQMDPKGMQSCSAESSRRRKGIVRNYCMSLDVTDTHRGLAARL